MVGKLKSLIRSPRLSLPFKAGVFGLLLYYLYATGGGFLPTVAFFVGAIFFYARPMFNNFQFLRTFVVFLTLSYVAPSLYGEIAFFPLAVAFAFLFYILLGIKDMLFIRRIWWHEALHTALLYGVFLAFFAADKSNYFIWQYVGLGIAAMLLTSELLSYHAHAVPQKMRWTVSMALAFVLMQAAWVIALLPVGFLSATAAMTAIAFVAAHLSLGRFMGTLERKTIVRYGIFIFCALALVAMTSRWGK